jgi:hypothetical protein
MFAEYALELYNSTSCKFGKRFYTSSTSQFKDALQNAINGFMKEYYLENEIALFVYDDTAFGGGKQGFAITNKYIYCDAFKKIPVTAVENTRLSGNDVSINGHNIHVVFIDNKNEFTDFLQKLFYGFRRYLKDIMISRVPNTELSSKINEGLVAYQKLASPFSSVSVGTLNEINMQKIENFIAYLVKVFMEKYETEIRLKSEHVIAFYQEGAYGDIVRGISIVSGNGDVYLVSTLEQYTGVLDLGSLKKRPVLKNGLFKSKLILDRKNESVLEISLPKDEGLAVFFQVLDYIYCSII